MGTNVLVGFVEGDVLGFFNAGWTLGSELGEVLREYKKGTEVKLSEGSIDGGQELGDVDSTNVDGSSSDAGSDEGEILGSDDGIEIGPADEGDVFGSMMMALVTGLMEAPEWTLQKALLMAFWLEATKDPKWLLGWWNCW